MSEYRKSNPDENLPYDRPSISSWIAAAAVALVVFMMGGFIKTYYRLEMLEAETTREIQELRQIVDKMRLSDGQAAPQRQNVHSRGSAGESRFPRTRSPGRGSDRHSDRPTMSSPITEYERRLIPDIDGKRKGITYAFGRKSAQAAALSAGGVSGGERRDPCQVISIDSQQNRVMIEGGRNLGLDGGARLELSRDGRWIADLRVMDVFDDMSACEVLHATLAPQPGDLVRNVESALERRN